MPPLFQVMKKEWSHLNSVRSSMHYVTIFCLEPSSSSYLNENLPIIRVISFWNRSVGSRFVLPLVRRQNELLVPLGIPDLGWGNWAFVFFSFFDTSNVTLNGTLFSALLWSHQPWGVQIFLAQPSKVGGRTTVTWCGSAGSDYGGPRFEFRYNRKNFSW